MSRVVSELTNSVIFRAHILVGRWTNSMSLKIIPESIPVRPGGSVSYENVVWMGDPEASWSLISVKERPGSLCLYDEVILDVVVGLNGIFNEDCVSLNLVCNVFLQS